MRVFIFLKVQKARLFVFFFLLLASASSVNGLKNAKPL